MLFRFSLFYKDNICVCSSSQELLRHPELEEIDLIKDVDMLIFTEWVSKAKDELLQRVKVRTTICSLGILTKTLVVVGHFHTFLVYCKYQPAYLHFCHLFI